METQTLLGPTNSFDLLLKGNNKNLSLITIDIHALKKNNDKSTCKCPP